MATLFDSASLVMIPSGVKEDKLYSIKPTDGSGDFTFSRDADIEATRVNSSGLIEKAKVNLLLQSNAFLTSPWGKSNANLTSGQSGYDGSSDAWLLDTTSAGGSVYQDYTNTGVQSVSVYAKKGTADGIRVRLNQTTDTNVYVDLRDGSVFTSNNTIDIDIQDVGSGWYRVTLSALFDSGIARVLFYPTDGEQASVAGTIYIQDAALCHGLIAQDYVETTTTAVVEGLTADLPRLDYSGGASCPSLLLEPSRTNLIPHSEYIDDGGWTKSSATITTNHATSAEGVQNASLVTFGSGGYILESVTTTKTIGSTETISVFSNADISGTFLKYGGGTAAGTDVEDREVIGNGWYRYYVTRTFTEAETGSTQLLIAQSNVGDSVLIYGAQLEAGYLTSYIPTYGTAANRGEDTSLGQSIGLGNSHTIFFNGVLNSNENNKVFMELVTSGGSNSATIRNVIGTLRLYNQIDGNYPLGGIQSTNNKWVIRIDSNTYTLFYNNAGTPASQSGSFATARDMDKINIKGEFGELTTNQVLAFDSALTDSECNALVQ